MSTRYDHARLPSASRPTPQVSHAQRNLQRELRQRAAFIKRYQHLEKYASDAIQEAVLKLLESNNPKYQGLKQQLFEEPTEDLFKVLYTIACNQARDQHRHLQRQHLVDDMGLRHSKHRHEDGAEMQTLGTTLLAYVDLSNDTAERAARIQDVRSFLESGREVLRFTMRLELALHAFKQSSQRVDPGLMVAAFRGYHLEQRPQRVLASELGITLKQIGRYIAKVRSFVAQYLSARGV